METVELSVELVNSVLGYLGSRPFIEVAGFIESIKKEAASQMPEIPAEEPTEE